MKKTTIEQIAGFTTFDLGRPAEVDPNLRPRRIQTGFWLNDDRYLRTDDITRGEIILPKQAGRIILSQPGFVIAMYSTDFFERDQYSFVEVPVGSPEDITLANVAQGIFWLANPSIEGITRDDQAYASACQHHVRR
jgi:hypothetical protein